MDLKGKGMNLINISGVPSYERAFLQSIRDFKTSRIRYNKIQDGKVEIVDFGITQRAYLDTLLEVKRFEKKGTTNSRITFDSFFELFCYALSRLKLKVSKKWRGN